MGTANLGIDSSSCDKRVAAVGGTNTWAVPRRSSRHPAGDPAASAALTTAGSSTAVATTGIAAAVFSATLTVATAAYRGRGRLH